MSIINFNYGSHIAAIFFRFISAVAFCFSTNLYAVDSIVGELDNQGRLHADILISIDSLAESLSIDQDANSVITKTELNSSVDLIANSLRSNIRIIRANEPCTLTIGSNWKFIENEDVNSLIIPAEYHCVTQGNLSIQYKLNTKRPIEIKISDGQRSFHKLIDASQDFVFFDLFEKESVFLDFVQKGIIHLLTGYDHILFLFTLLLGAVLVRSDNYWAINSDVVLIFKNIFLVITAFTLSHSLTLGLTVFGLITTPSKAVEVLIALTMLASAVNNIYPFVNKIVKITFIFGLIHGFGFAGALGETGFTNNQQALALFSFNLGIEIGQLLIVALMFPFLIYIRKYSWYYSYFVRFLSFVIGCFALGLAITRL